MKKRLLSFGAVGVFNTLLNLLIFNILIFIHIGIGYANLISICISVVIAFFLSRRFVFGDRDEGDGFRKRFIKFAATNFLSLFVVQQGLLLFFVYVFMLPGDMAYEILVGYLGLGLSELFVEANTAKILAVAASMVTNFILYDKFVFKNKKKIDAEDNDEPQSN